MNNKRQNFLGVVVLLIIFLGLYILAKKTEKNNYWEIKKHQSVARIFNVQISREIRSWRTVDFSFYTNNRLVRKSEPIGAEDYDRYGEYIKDSSMLVYDSIDSEWRELIFMPGQFKKYSLDTSDKFYRGIFGK